MSSSLDSKLATIKEISDKSSDSTIFQLLWYIENLSILFIKIKDRLRSIKDSKTLLEAEITIDINLDDSIKATNKKSAIDIAKTKNAEYIKLNQEYNETKYFIESIEDLIKMLTTKYKLVEPAFHMQGVLTYRQLESEYRNK